MSKYNREKQLEYNRIYKLKNREKALERDRKEHKKSYEKHREEKIDKVLSRYYFKKEVKRLFNIYTIYE